MLRTHYVDQILAAKGSEVAIAGWVDNLKELPNLRFIILRDRTGVAQVTIHKKNSPPEVVAASEGLNLQDALLVSGSVPEKQIAKVGPEVQAKKITVLSRSETPLP